MNICVNVPTDITSVSLLNLKVLFKF